MLFFAVKSKFKRVKETDYNFESACHSKHLTIKKKNPRDLALSWSIAVVFQTAFPGVQEPKEVDRATRQTEGRLWGNPGSVLEDLCVSVYKKIFKIKYLLCSRHFAKDTTVAKTDTWSLASRSLSRLTTKLWKQHYNLVSEHSVLSAAFTTCTCHSSARDTCPVFQLYRFCLLISMQLLSPLRNVSQTLSDIQPAEWWTPSSTHQALCVYCATMILTAGLVCLCVFVQTRLQGLSELQGG